jgi:hypothetical protein
LALSIAAEHPAFAKVLLRCQLDRIVSLVHGHALMHTKSTNMRDIACACKWLSAATSLASSAVISCDFVPFFAECLASGVCSWLHVLSCCDPASFKASVASMYRNAASASKCTPPNAFTDMFRCLAHLLMAKAGKGSDVDALAICYKTVARAPADLASRSIGSMAISLLPQANASALSGTVCMMFIALAKKCNTPTNLEVLLHNFSGEKALGTLLTLLLSASRGQSAPSSARLSSVHSLIPASLTPEWSAALSQCVQYSSEFWPDIISIFGGKTTVAASGHCAVNASTLLSLPSLALQLLSSNKLQEVKLALACHPQVPELLSHLMTTKPSEGFKVARKWVSALRLSGCGIETCWSIAGVALNCALNAGSEDDVASVLSEMPPVDEGQQLQLLHAILQHCAVAAKDSLGVVCLLFQSGCVKSLNFGCLEDLTSTPLSRATYSFLNRSEFLLNSSASCDGVLGKFGRDWADFQIMQNTCDYLLNSVDLDHGLIQSMLSQQFAISPTFHRVSLMLSHADVLVSAGRRLEAKAVITKLLSYTPFWSGKFICKDVLNCLSSCVRSLHLGGFFSYAASLADDFHSVAPDQISKLHSFPPKTDRNESSFSFVSCDAAACESLRAFMNGNLQKAVHLSSLAVKLAIGNKNNLSSSDVKPQHLQELSTLRQRYRIISCCFLACTMASHSCLSVESQYYMKTASTLVDSMQSLPSLIRQHIEVEKKSCVVSMLKFHCTNSSTAQEVVSELKESNHCLNFEIIYHLLLRFGTSEVEKTLALAPSKFHMDETNVFSVTLATVRILLTELRGCASPSEVLKQKSGKCAPLLCDAVLQWCSESLVRPDGAADSAHAVSQQSLVELESLTVAQLKSRASDLGLAVPSKSKKADMARLIFDHQSIEADKNTRSIVDSSILEALECVWSLCALNGSPSTVRNTAALFACLLSASAPSTAAFAVLSATGVRARHIVDELMKLDSSSTKKSSEAWWQNSDALRVFETFHKGCLNIKSSSGWERAVHESTSSFFICSISVYSNHVTVTRSSSFSGTASYTQRNVAEFSMEDLESLHLDSPGAEAGGRSKVDSDLWNSWGIFSSLGKEMESIIEASDRTLGSSSNAKTIPEKKQWWADRDDSDRRLQVLCRRLERLVGPVALSLLIPPVQEKALSLQIQKLALQVQSAIKPEVLEAMMHAAPVIGFDALEPFVDLACIDALKQLWSSCSHLDLGRWSAVLVLPPPLHHFPWESMPALRNCSISRMISPSICFAAAAAHPKNVDTRNAYYIINPGGDLVDTQSFFEPWFSSVPGWSGCAGSAPSANEALERISQSHLFM